MQLDKVVTEYLSLKDALVVFFLPLVLLFAGYFLGNVFLAGANGSICGAAIEFLVLVGVI
ncbi:MAG: hypothetical protein P8184_18450 [Calditrichia bacterium]